MKVDEKKAAGSSILNGTTYFFCSKMCKEEFDKNSSKYVR
jgi:YHS domain-containing protein